MVQPNPPENPPAAVPAHPTGNSPSLVERILAAILGFIFLGVLAYAGLRERPILDPTQQIMLRVVAAISAAACAGIISGFVEVQFKGWLRAGGALAVFCVVWFTNPPRAVSPPSSIDGTWVSGGSNAEVLICHQSDRQASCTLNNSAYQQTLDGSFADSRTVRGTFVRTQLSTGCTITTPFSIALENSTTLRLSWRIDEAKCDLPAGFENFDPEFHQN